MSANRCVVCNEIIPEGRMICLSCEHQHIKVGKILQSRRATTKEVEQACEFTKRKGERQNEEN